MCSGHQLNLLGMCLKILNILRILILSIHVYYNVQLITLDDIHFYSSGIMGLPGLNGPLFALKFLALKNSTTALLLATEVREKCLVTRLF